MELIHEFVVPVGVDDAWKVLTDVERIAPCMPGAELQEIDGDEYRGVVKIKVGPITAQYKGKATFTERDDEKYRAVLRAEGRDTRGQGNANATITATLVPEGDGTRVEVVTDLMVTGRVAQFGRGVMADISAKLISQFATCLQTRVLSGETVEPPEPAGPAPMPSVSGDGSAPVTERPVVSTPAGPVDLLETAGVPLLKRLAPAVLGAVLLVFLKARISRRRRGRT